MTPDRLSNPRRREVTDMAKVLLRYARYALTSLTTVGFAFSGS